MERDEQDRSTAAGVRVVVLDGDIDDPGSYTASLSAGLEQAAEAGHGAAVGRVLQLDWAQTRDDELAGRAVDYASRALGQSFADALAAERDADVVNASWGVGRLFADNLAAGAYEPAGNALHTAVTEGRGGLGQIVVFAAGNARQSGDDVNHHGFQNAPETIAVGALDVDGQPAAFSTPGAAVLLAALGTDVPLGEDTGREAVNGETTTVTGTSFAAPKVSAAAARMLSVNPELSQRDVQTILASTAQPVPERAMPETGITSNPWDVDNSTAQISPIGTVNGASDWNGGGRLFDARVGFGALDTEAAVRLAAAWTPGGTQADLVTRTVNATPNSAIPDGGGPLVIPLALEPDVAVEHVQLALEITHGWIGDLTATLVSPNGTRSVLLDRPGKVPGSDGHGSSADDLDFTLTSNAFRGEDAGGVWELEVRDAASGFAGRLEAASLEVAGTPATGNDVYIFTDVYASLAAFDPGRGQLSDASGDDHLQAAALSDDAVIDLEPGAISRLADQPLEVRAGTEIEDATGGSGNDRILGNGADNTLVGGPGADVLYGRSGADVLDGGPGDDRLHGGPGADTFVVSAGTDTVADFTPWAGDRLASGQATAGPTDEGSAGVQVSRTADGVELRLDDGARVRLAGIDTFDADWFAA